MKYFAAAVLTILATVAQAAPVTINFEEFSAQPVANPTTLQSQGFNISGGGSEGTNGFAAMALKTGANGTLVFSGDAKGIPLDGFGPEVAFTLERSDGTAFALYSVDFMGSGVGTGSIFGYTDDGRTITNDANYFFYEYVDFGTADWLNITGAQFLVRGDGFTDCCQAYAEIDNIVVGAAVPIPAAVWLFGSALALLGWIRQHS